MITIKSKDEIVLMEEAGRIVAETFDVLEKSIEPGISTLELSKIGEKFIKSQNAYPTFKGYGGFPEALCISIDDEVVHGIPGLRKLKNGNIVSIDIGATFKGYCGDAARTFAVGDISPEAQKLIEITKNSFYKGIEFAFAGNKLSDISHAIQMHVEENGFSVVRDYVGHGIGRKLHEDPSIPNYGKEGRGPRLLEGMTLAIEPMVNVGTYKVKVLDNEWTVVTSDGKLSAHYENTVLITDGAPKILTIK